MTAKEKGEELVQICNRDKHNEDIFNYGNCLQCGNSEEKIYKKIMTAKEYAEELVQVYFRIVSDSNPLEDILVSAKKCALTFVDKMIEFAYDIEWEKKGEAISKLKFLKEVKQEINKLYDSTFFN